jgi:hypothetical protein
MATPGLVSSTPSNHIDPGYSTPFETASKAASSNDTYFMISPTFETTSKKYSWLNNVVAVGKIVSSKGGADGHVTYDIYVVR